VRLRFGMGKEWPAQIQYLPLDCAVEELCDPSTSSGGHVLGPQGETVFFSYLQAQLPSCRAS
jgi:hypothetical protein